MGRSKPQALPKFGSLDELVEFFDSHDMGQYWESMPQAHFDISIKRRTHLFALDEELAERLTAVAKVKHVPPQRLLNAWLKEKLLEQGQGIA